MAVNRTSIIDTIRSITIDIPATNLAASDKTSSNVNAAKLNIIATDDGGTCLSSYN